jgi:hypothetical protein
VDLDTKVFLEQATGHLGHAFDCTLVALTLSLLVMLLIHLVQREEEALVIDCQQYCLENLVNRIYEPETASEAANTVLRAATTQRQTGWQSAVVPPLEKVP